MEIPSLHANVNAEAKVDLTDAITEIAKNGSEIAKGIQETIQDPIKESSIGLITACKKICMALGGPWVARRIGEAQRETAQAEKDCLDIANGLCKWNSENRTMESLTSSTTLHQYCMALTQNEAEEKGRRLINSITDSLKQLKVLASDSIPDTPINQNFFSHWRNEAELIDEEEMRKMWSSLLTAEVCKPNSVSLRTLNIVKNMSCEDARMFEKISLGRVDAGVIIDNHGIPLFGDYLEMLSLIDLGLFNSNISQRTFNPSVVISGQKQYLVYCQDYFIAFLGDNPPKISVHLFTKAGKELLCVLTKRQTIQDYQVIATELSKQNANCEVALHKKISDDTAEIVPVWKYPK